MATKEKVSKQQKKRFGGRLLTVAMVLLVVAGVCVMAYPFVLTGIIERNKDEVVRALEEELPIYRDAGDFQAVDIASMPVVDTPHWTAEEMAQAGEPMGVMETLLGTDTRSAIANVLGGNRQSTPTSNLDLPVGDMPTLIPQVLARGDAVETLSPEAFVQQAGQSPQVTATPAPTPQQEVPTEPPVEGVEILYETPAPDEAQGEVDTQPDQTQGPQQQVELAQAGEGDALSLADQRRLALEEMLSSQAPVYFEDFAEIPQRASTLVNSLTDLAVSLETQRQHEVSDDLSLTFQSIQGQFLSTQSLFTVVQDFPSAAQTGVIFESREDGQQHTVSAADSIATLQETLQLLGRAHVAAQVVSVYPQANDQVNLALDEIVTLSDQVQNILDYTARYLPDSDVDMYMRFRSSALVGETEAVYLMEIPSIGLKVGCFQSLTFEQMYRSMRKGAALFPRVGTPNTNTNITMSAHRTGSAAFFKDFDSVQEGDEILLHTRTLGSFRYLVETVKVVDSDDWTTTYTVGYPALTLISCEEYEGVSHGKRIVVRGRLVGITN